jgi:glycosyltransferase involved in cell wall biosynthesis
MQNNVTYTVGPCKPPKVSVVTVVFNGVLEIAKTIDSVLEQDYSNLEYIVIDGESSDGTTDIIRKYEKKIDIFICERDEGIYDAMNKSIALASGEFILFMNCGDVFASIDAISSAMRSTRSDVDQVIFGGWLRRKNSTSLLSCHPVLKRGIFNHQAIIYSRNIHAWHGNYANIKGLSTADYLFFITLIDSSAVLVTRTDVILAIVDVNGLSSGPQTLSQKFAIDYICGRVGNLRLLAVLVLHPLYRRAKILLKWLR